MPTPFADHAVPAGPLAVRWLSHQIPLQRAGIVSVGQVELENAGAVDWDSRDGYGICLGYHWLDPLGNAIVWDGLLSAFPKAIAPGERVNATMTIAGPVPPGRYRLALDLVDGGRCWFSEVGNLSPEIEVEVSPRLARRRLRVRITEGQDELADVTREALARQEEEVDGDGDATAFLAAGSRPRPDWSRRILDAHEEGYGVVGGAIEVEGSRRERRRLSSLRPWAPGFGRAPEWGHSLLCPSLTDDLLEQARWLDPVAGLPAVHPPGSPQTWICDGRIVVGVSARALQLAARRFG
jgi:hypothetical protein